MTDTDVTAPVERQGLSARWRLGIVGAVAAVVLGIFVVTGLQDNMVYYRSPSEITSGSTEHVRLGGMVQHDSIERNDGVLRFTVTDGVSSVPVEYRGTTTGVFREGQGAVVEGTMPEGVFVADTLLVMHDNQYVSEDGTTYDVDDVQQRP